MKIRVAGEIEESIVDGPGLRYVLFVQGCPIHCKGCQNPQTWDMDGGKLVSVRAILEKIRSNPLIKGVTFSGGEPFAQAEALLPLARVLKRSGYHVMSYSGYTFEELMKSDACRSLLFELDLLVDGPFIEEQKSLELLFRGSRNQRIIDLKATCMNGWKPVEWSEDGRF